SSRPQLIEPWFTSSYAFDVNNAVSRWSQSITAYTDIYGSNYLRDLSFVTCVSGVNDTLCGSPDIQVRFIESFGSQSSGLGLTRYGGQNSVFQAPTITTLVAYDASNTTQISGIDMVNIASHERGHDLGLYHATAYLTDDGTL